MEKTYWGHFTEMDVMELYSKTMANLGPLNVIFEKEFSYSCEHGGFTNAHFHAAREAYLAVQIMEHMRDVGTPQRVSMERHIPFGTAQRFSLENYFDDGQKIRAVIEGSPRTVRRIERALDTQFEKPAEIVPDIQAELENVLKDYFSKPLQ